MVVVSVQVTSGAHQQGNIQCEAMRKADSRINKKWRGTGINDILWQEYWERCQSVSLKLQSETLASQGRQQEKNVWQSHVEIEHCSVAYFDRIITFKALQRSTLVEIRNRIMFDFNSRLPHVQSSFERIGRKACYKILPQKHVEKLSLSNQPIEQSYLTSLNPLGPIVDISTQLAQYRFVASYSAATCDKELTLLLVICQCFHSLKLQ